MHEFARRIEAAAAYLLAGQPAEAENEINFIDPDLLDRSEVLFLEYGVRAAREEWRQARHFASILRRRYRNQPAMVLLLTEAMRNEAKPWEAGSVLRAAEKRFPADIEIQHHLLRHEIEFDAPAVALRRIGIEAGNERSKGPKERSGPARTRLGNVGRLGM